jgi:hypothetical protein
VKRRVFNILAGVSLLLLVFTVLFVDSDRGEAYPPGETFESIHVFGWYCDLNWHSRLLPYGIPATLILAPAFSVLPILWLKSRFWKRRNVKSAYCIHCGYDLRATPDQCPECGATTPKKQIISN